MPLILVTEDTVLKIEESSVVLEAVECLGFVKNQHVNYLEKADVALNMISPEGRGSDAHTTCCGQHG
jgi:hypothetical protein